VVSLEEICNLVVLLHTQEGSRRGNAKITKGIIEKDKIKLYFPIKS
tara:strand:+ start:227 stop:364 length:138 start_codon:yes stop_codon:yes gene_type:complete